MSSFTLICLGNFESNGLNWELYIKESARPEYFCRLYKGAERIADFWRSTRAGIDAALQPFLDAASEQLAEVRC